MNLYKESPAEPYSVFVIDITYLADNSLHFIKNILETI